MYAKFSENYYFLKTNVRVSVHNKVLAFRKILRTYSLDGPILEKHIPNHTELFFLL